MLALEVPFCCLVQIWHVFVDELDGELGPHCIISNANVPDEGFFWWESGHRMVTEEVLACAWEVKDDVYGFIVWGLFVGHCVFCVKGEFPKACVVTPFGF